LKPLLALSDEILALEADLEREDLTDEQREALVDAWLEAQGDVKPKLDNYAGLIRELDARSEVRAAEARRLVALANADAKQAASLSARLKAYFERHELTKFQTSRFNLTLQGHGGKAPLVIPPAWESDPASAPEAFQRRTIQLDKDAIRSEVASAGKLCPTCGGDPGSILEPTDDAAADRHVIVCQSCGWQGGPAELVRLGERGASIRIR
jgi:hypothetical protein